MRTMRRRERRFRLAATYGAARNRPYDAACCGRNDTASAEIKTWLISVSDAAYRMWILRGYIRRVWLWRCRTALMSTNAAWTRLNGLQGGHANFKVCEYVMYIQWRNFWHCLHSRPYAKQGLCNGRPSVCPIVSLFVPSFHRSSGLRRVWCKAPYGKNISIDSGGRRRTGSAATAPQHGIRQQMRAVSCWQPSSRGWTQTCIHRVKCQVRASADERILEILFTTIYCSEKNSF